MAGESPRRGVHPYPRIGRSVTHRTPPSAEILSAGRLVTAVDPARERLRASRRGAPKEQLPRKPLRQKDRADEAPLESGLISPTDGENPAMPGRNSQVPMTEGE